MSRAMPPARPRNRTSAKRAGARFAASVAGFLARHVDDRIEPRHGTGARDRGDIAAVRSHGQRVVIECKDTTAWNPGTWLREAEIERGNDDAYVGVVVCKRRNTSDPGEQVVLMSLRDFAALLTGQRPEEDQHDGDEELRGAEPIAAEKPLPGGVPGRDL